MSEKISHQLHIDLTWTSMHFSMLTPSRGKKFLSKKGGNDYVFRFGMVLVACDCGGTYHRYPVQG